MEKISVIVPVYKVEEYLEKCIESIINQTYINLEIILVDDGSPDNCGKICDTYAEKDSRIKVIHKKNGGLSDARNAGIEQATGDFYMFIDSDDYIDKTMCEKLYHALNKQKTDVAVCNLKCVDANGNEICEMNDISPFVGEIMTEDEIFDKFHDTNYWFFVVAWNKLYRKQIFEEIRFPFGRIHEDEFTFHHIIKKCGRLAIVPEELYYYVQRENSIVNSERNIKNLDGSEAFFNRVDFAFKEERNELALISLRRGLNTMLSCYEISKKSEENKKRFTEIHEIYKRQYRLLCKKKIKIDFKTKIFFLRAAHNLEFFFFLSKVKSIFKK